MKGKLMPFYRAAKPSSTSSSTSHGQYTSSKVMMKPIISQSTTPSVPASVAGFLVPQDYVISAQPKPKVSFILPDNSGSDSLVQFDNLYGVAVDESVDSKAASYISSVQERFKLERINSERVKYPEMIR
ncbi:hypothetical protein TIFTF001_026595 [Ficus carica]|uniref:Uncharacterized protein n=1 Tax=Ficus carica TaxID=3494 RepID=A0AA88DLF2_FICCA|nr:hypothetical protein TIFTF001_026595 [Ficus carica]